MSIGRGRVSVRVRGHLRLRQRDGATVAARPRDQFGQLVGSHHASMDRDVRDLVRRVDLHADDVGVRLELLPDTRRAARAGEGASPNREGLEAVAPWLVRRHRCGRRAVLVLCVGSAGHWRAPPMGVFTLSDADSASGYSSVPSRTCSRDSSPSGEVLRAPRQAC
jgi:hypothetical protein